MKKEEARVEFVTCDCGYNNQPYNVEKYGTCRYCGKVLDAKAKFEYEMYCRLHLWKNKKRGEKI